MPSGWLARGVAVMAPGLAASLVACIPGALTTSPEAFGVDAGVGSPSDATPSDSRVQPDGRSDGTVPDAGSLLDGAHEAALEGGDAGCLTPPNGRPCDPGFVTCDDTPCAVPASFCCAKFGARDASADLCDPNGTACADSTIACDERSDCPNGSICCLVLRNSGQVDVSCQHGACSGGIFSIQICKTNAECANAMPCEVQTCGAEGGVVEACGPIPTCLPM